MFCVCVRVCVQMIHNLTLPRWATRDVLDTLRRIASFEVMYSILSHKRKEKARLSGGRDSYLEAIDFSIVVTNMLRGKQMIV